MPPGRYVPIHFHQDASVVSARPNKNALFHELGRISLARKEADESAMSVSIYSLLNGVLHEHLMEDTS